jgi:hypothetical protein
MEIYLIRSEEKVCKIDNIVKDRYNFTCCNTSVVITWYKPTTKWQGYKKHRILEWRKNKVRIENKTYYVCKT